jgi:hypothetical protein
MKWLFILIGVIVVLIAAVASSARNIDGGYRRSPIAIQREVDMGHSAGQRRFQVAHL